ncbi:MAG: hypothetical protein ABI836_03840 [Gemmatimonadota bacterium]
MSWKIVYSTAPLDTIRVGYGPNNYGLGAAAGSYTVRVYALPRSGSGTTWIYGAEGIQDLHGVYRRGRRRRCRGGMLR